MEVFALPFTTNLDEDEDTFTTEVVGPGPQADLAIFKTDVPDPVIGGQNITYSVTVFNQGPDDATGVIIRDILPPGTTFVVASPGCNLVPGNRVQCDIAAPIPPGGFRIRNITVTAPVPAQEISILNNFVV